MLKLASWLQDWPQGSIVTLGASQNMRLSWTKSRTLSLSSATTLKGMPYSSPAVSQATNRMTSNLPSSTTKKVKQSPCTHEPNQLYNHINTQCILLTCVYTHMYTWVCVYIHTYTHVRMHTHTCVRVYVCVRVCMHTHNVCVCMYVCMYVCVCVCVCVYVCLYVYIKREDFLIINLKTLQPNGFNANLNFPNP